MLSPHLRLTRRALLGRSAGEVSLPSQGSVIEKYRIEELLGTGGFAAVYRATHLLLRIPVALKLLKPKVLRQRPGWIRKVNRELEAKGAKVKAQFAVLGPYDFVTILEAADNETVSSISIEMGARGTVSMMTMPAIPLDTFITRLQQSDKPGRRARRHKKP